MTIRINTLEDINRAAEQFLPLLAEHRIFAFYGGMGAGKTTFISALCHKLGVTDHTGSPTFAIVNEYNSDPSIVNGQRSMVNGQRSMVNGQWSMVNGQWSMVNGEPKAGQSTSPCISSPTPCAPQQTGSAYALPATAPRLPRHACALPPGPHALRLHSRHEAAVPC